MAYLAMGVVDLAVGWLIGLWMWVADLAVDVGWLIYWWGENESFEGRKKKN
jgi:hypothetical protein